jgi:hypothetical protein
MKIFLSYASASFSTVIITWFQKALQKCGSNMVDGAALLRVERMLMISNFSPDIPYYMRDFSTKVICSLI